MRKRAAKKYTQMILATVAFLLLVGSFFAMLLIGISPPRDEKAIAFTQELLDKTDLSKESVRLASEAGMYYRGKLYTPADFKEGAVTQGDSGAQYATFRAVVRVPAGKIYGLAGSTASYSQRVWVNGTLLSEVGGTSDSPTNFVPRTDSYAVYFMAEQSEVELVIQVSWHNRSTGFINTLYLGEQQVIVDRERRQHISDGMLMGALFGISLFFFGMFLFFTRRKALLLFSGACLCAAVHYMVFHHKTIMLLFPELPWAISHKTEYFAQISYYYLLFAFGVVMLGLQGGRWAKRVGTGVYLFIITFILFTPASIYTKYLVYCHVAFALMMIWFCGYLVYRAIKERLFLQIENTIVLSTMILSIIVLCLEVTTYLNRSWYIQPYSTLLFVFLNAVVLTISFANTEQSLVVSRQKEQENAQRSAMLEQMNALKTDFLRSMAHEMKTPLTVMGGYAQLIDWQLAQNDANSETFDGLRTISSESQRLGELVSRLLQLSAEEQMVVEKNKVSVKDLFADAAAICRPVVLKNGNSLTAEVAGCPSLHANHDMMLQVLINLAVNASQHTQQGHIALTAQADGDMVLLRVADTGSGIEPSDIAHIFERGYSANQSSGLGLNICQTVVEAHGGTIAVERTDSHGTTICFSVPQHKKGEVSDDG